MLQGIVLIFSLPHSTPHLPLLGASHVLLGSLETTTTTTSTPRECVISAGHSLTICHPGDTRDSYFTTEETLRGWPKSTAGRWYSWVPTQAPGQSWSSLYYAEASMVFWAPGCFIKAQTDSPRSPVPRWWLAR